MKLINIFLIMVMTTWAFSPAQTNTQSTNGTYSRYVAKGTTVSPEVDGFIIPRMLTFNLIQYRKNFDLTQSLLQKSQETLKAANTLIEFKDSRIVVLESLNTIMEKQLNYFKEWGNTMELREKKLNDLNRGIILIGVGAFLFGILVTSLAILLAAKGLQSLK